MSDFHEGLNLLVYDFEVVKNDWIAVLKRYGQDDFHVFHNDAWGLTDFLQEENPVVLAGFNVKHYDKWILKAVTQHRDPSDIKELNDWIIGGKEGWQHPFFADRGNGLNIPQFDIRDDMQDGISLKSIEAQMGWDIRESEVSFDIDRPLTESELSEMITYCKADVTATERIIEMRKDYLTTKCDIGEMCGLTRAAALSMTNATLTARYLHAQAQTFRDERDYIFPDTLKWEYIPQIVKDFFARGKRMEIPDDEVFTGTCEFDIGDCPVTVAWGGIHAAIPTYTETETEERVIRNWDVASLYPSLMIQYGYTSRCMDNPQDFVDVYNTRIRAKHSGDKKTANNLKLILNTTYGAMLLPGGNLYDPRMGRSVCVSGQLLILQLAMHLVKEFPSLKVIQLNTDGIMVSCLKSDLDSIHAIIDEWQERTRLVLQEDEIHSVCAQKDVNNYVMQLCDGHYKSKGAYFKQGVNLIGAFSVNNDFNIVKTAVFKALTEGIDPAETINACDDFRQFQLVARGGSKYSHVTHEVDGEQITVQKCNRVYASKYEIDGLLYKYHRDTGRRAKIANCPQHCFIINDEQPVDMDWIDKQWYIALAKKRVSDFKPKVKRKKREEQTEMEELKQESMELEPVTDETLEAVQEEQGVVNTIPVPLMPTFKQTVYAKLAKARRLLTESGIKPTGKNTHAKFKYFELGDFVPQATKIFDELGLVSIFNMSWDGSHAEMTVIDTDNTNSYVTFSIPYTKAPNIVSRDGKQVTSDIQIMGAGLSYHRRYLYLMALDVASPDEVDAETVEESVFKPTTPAVASAPVTREEAREQLTKAQEAPSEADVKELKAALLALREIPGNEPYIQQVAMETKGFSSFSHERHEAYMIEIGKRVSEGRKG